MTYFGHSEFIWNSSILAMVTINKTLPNVLKSFLNTVGNVYVKLFKNANSIITIIKNGIYHDDKGTIN